MADEPELHQGDQGEWVTYLQGLLDAAGHPPGRLDGWFGPITEGAVRSFQSADGCMVDGWVGPETWGAINALGLQPTTVADTSGASRGGDVPQDLVAAGAPAQFSQWSEDQKAEYFKQAEGEDLGGEAPEQLEVAAIGGAEDGGTYA